TSKGTWTIQHVTTDKMQTLRMAGCSTFLTLGCLRHTMLAGHEFCWAFGQICAALENLVVDGAFYARAVSPHCPAVRSHQLHRTYQIGSFCRYCGQGRPDDDHRFWRRRYQEVHHRDDGNRN